MPDPLDTHYTTVITAITDGEVVFFLGAGVNLCGRPKGTTWQHGQYLPSGGELAEYLAAEFKFTTYREGQVNCPHCGKQHPVRYPLSDMQDLGRVSQYADVMRGSAPLYKKLHHVFNANYPPTPLHDFLATLPAVLCEKGHPPYQLIVTTNYDDLLERAFKTAGEPFDLVTYVTEGDQRGKFLHWLPDGQAKLIDKPNEYRDLSLDQRSVILKIHGAVDRASVDQSSFVITEDHYIEYLTRTDISSLVPIKLADKLRNSGYLFLGYSLRDWNLRVILHRIWGEQKLTYKSWAIQLNPQELDRKFWAKREVDIQDIRLEDYITELSKGVQALPHAGGPS